jgi:hypothetical protein
VVTFAGADVVWGGPVFTKGRTTTTTKVFTPDFEVLIALDVLGVKKQPGNLNLFD